GWRRGAGLRAPAPRVDGGRSRAFTLAFGFSGMEAWIGSREGSSSPSQPASERLLAHLPRRNAVGVGERLANLPFRRAAEVLAGEGSHLDRHGAERGLHLLEAPLEGEALHRVVAHAERGRLAQDGLDDPAPRRGGGERAQEVAGPALLHDERGGPGIERPRAQAGVDRAGDELRGGVVELGLHHVEDLAGMLERAEAGPQYVRRVLEVAVADPVADPPGDEGAE